MCIYIYICIHTFTCTNVDIQYAPWFVCPLVRHGRASTEEARALELQKRAVKRRKELCVCAKRVVSPHLPTKRIVCSTAHLLLSPATCSCWSAGTMQMHFSIVPTGPPQHGKNGLMEPGAFSAISSSIFFLAFGCQEREPNRDKLLGKCHPVWPAPSSHHPFRPSSSPLQTALGRQSTGGELVTDCRA